MGMVRIVDGAGRRTWVTGRDEQVCEWLSIVGMTDVQAIRWVLGALNDVEGPVSTRRAQTWVARLEVVGLVERANLGGPGGSIVWASTKRPDVVGRIFTGRPPGMRSRSLRCRPGTSVPGSRGGEMSARSTSAATRPTASRSGTAPRS